MKTSRTSKSKKGNKKKAQHVVPKTRKELRKEKRHQKKENRKNHFSNGGGKFSKSEVNVKTMIEKNLNQDEENDFSDEEIESDFSDVELPPQIAEFQKKQKEEQQKMKQPAKSAVSDLAADQHKRELEKQKKIEKESKKNRSKQMRRANVEEDKNIAKLEKMLKINKSKNKKKLVEKMFASDGLDYALELILAGEDEKPKAKKQKRQEEWEEEDAGNDESFGDEDDENFGEDEAAATAGDEEDEEPEEPKEQQDIYGRKRDVEGNVVSQKYVPPHQRAALLGSIEADSKKKEKMERLKRTCKGQLNRLSEANLHKIAHGFEKFYEQNSRYDMNQTLGEIMRESLIQPTLSNDRMVQEHVVLLCYLHAQIGSEIGAQFLQLFVNEFMEQLKDAEAKDVENKELNNILLILCYLYMFKIFQNNLMIEIVNKLYEVLCEKTIECLLLIFQSIGFRLRKDDPLSFKDLIFAIQKKIADSTIEIQENARLRYMYDVLTAVKNNNMTKLPKYDPELAENLRKKLKAMLQNDKYVTTLNITLKDLLRADQVGKWWVVGSAWSGNMDDIHGAGKDDNTKSVGEQTYSDKILKLAKKQKMNTAERKNIFCILMSAEDYIDAFEKIMHLSIKDQRTVATVIIHCSLMEKKYNAYYAHLAQKFSTYDRKYMLAFQFALWDRINDILTMEKEKISKLANFIFHMIKNQALSITVLKIANFSELDKDKKTFSLLKHIICGVLLLPSAEDVYPVFEKLTTNVKLKQFKGNLRLFMQHYLLKDIEMNEREKDTTLLVNRIEMVDKMLAYEDL